jgi:hypothetical protein
MKKTTQVLMLLVVTISAKSAMAASDFGSVVSGVERQYSVHAQRVPMMGFISFCAHVGSGGALKGLRVAEFDHLSLPPGEDRLIELMRSQLDAEWQPFVTTREKGGKEQTAIFVRPVGHAMRMLIADYENGELDIVRIELNGDKIARWIEHPRDEVHHAAHQGDEARAQ